MVMHWTRRLNQIGRFYCAARAATSVRASGLASQSRKRASKPTVWGVINKRKDEEDEGQTRTPQPPKLQQQQQQNGQPEQARGVAFFTTCHPGKRELLSAVPPQMGLTIGYA